MSVKKALFASMASIALGATLLAGSGRTGAADAIGTAAAPTLRIPDEMAPPGGMVQMKVETTEVTPISGGRPRLAFDSSMFSGPAGFGMFATGELAGAAILGGAEVKLSYTSNGALTADYPILTIAMRIRPDVAVGTRTLFTFDPQSIWNIPVTSPTLAQPISPAKVIAGGTVSIVDVVPGEGVWPAGTVVSVKGTGFSSRTQLRVNDVATRGIRVVSAGEMQFTLVNPTQVRGMRLVAQNPENTVTYFAYMRGIASVVSSRTLLAATEPIFSVTPRAVATIGPVPTMSASQYQGVALQNPNATDVTVAIAMYDARGTFVHGAAHVLRSRHRVALEVSEMLGGVAPPPGASVMVIASAPIDAIGLLCDEGSWTVSPSLPREAIR